MSEADEPLKIQGPLRRNAPLLAGLGLVILCGSAVTRLLQGYRAIVLEVGAERSFIAYESRPPEWIDWVGAQAGAVVVKERLHWDPLVVPTEAADHRLVDFHRRYSDSYAGVIARILEPRTKGGAHTAIVEVEGGETLRVPLHGEHLSGAAVGRRLRKIAGQWEPFLED
jgi:hypothetical protein